MSVKIFTDGASRGNPGDAGAGVVIYDDNILLEEISKYLGKKTNNQAEYTAVILALEKLDELKIKKADLFSDSEFLVKQINGQYKVKAEKIIPLFQKVKKLLENKQISFTWIPREKNSEADRLANLAIDNKNN